MELQEQIERQQKFIETLTKIVSDMTTPTVTLAESNKVCAAGGPQKERPHYLPVLQ